MNIYKPLNITLDNPSQQQHARENIKVQLEEESNEHQEDPIMLRAIVNYCKSFSHLALSSKHFLQYLKDNGVQKVAETKVLTQLTFFVEQYFRDSNLFQSITVEKKDRYHPYAVAKPPRRSNKSSLRRTTSNVAMSFDSGGNGQILVERNHPVNISLNWHAAVAPTTVVERAPVVSRVGQPVVPIDGVINVSVFLPDDSFAILSVPATDTVSDLRFKLRNKILAKYPAKRGVDVPLEKLKLFTEGGWELNISDPISDVIFEGKKVYCNMTADR